MVRNGLPSSGVSVTPLPHVADHRSPHHRVGRSTPELRPPRPDEVVAWVARLLGEVSRAPFTIYKVRQVMEALAELPRQIEELTTALDKTTGVLETTLPSVEDRLEGLGETFVGVDGRIEHLQGTVEEFSSAITNLIAAIPGARRTLRKP